MECIVLFAARARVCGALTVYMRGWQVGSRGPCVCVCVSMRAHVLVEICEIQPPSPPGVYTLHCVCFAARALMFSFAGRTARSRNVLSKSAIDFSPAPRHVTLLRNDLISRNIKAVLPPLGKQTNAGWDWKTNRDWLLPLR